MSTHDGKLIAFEGIDGAGKTTQVKLLATFLKSAGQRVVVSKEPTDGRWGRLIRTSATSGRLPIDEEVAAFIEDRKEHVEKTICPNLRRGAYVLVDRYYLSTAAYQGARGIDPESLLRRNEAFAPLPDLALILEISVEVALTRIKSRGQEKNEFELSENLRRVKVCFESLDRPYISRVDGSGDQGAVFRRLIDVLASRSVVPSSFLVPERIRDTILNID